MVEHKSYPKSLIVLFASVGILLAQAPAKAQETAGNSLLTQAEMRLFFHTYEGKDLNWRIAHLEKQVFGQEMTGTDSQRLKRVAGALPPEKKPAAPPHPVSSKTFSQAPATPEKDEEECAIERAHVEIAAAEEKQTQDMLQEGAALWRAGKTEEAEQKFAEVLQIDGGCAEAHFSLGIIEEANGNLAEALASYRKAFQTKPDNIEYQDAISAVQKKLEAWSNLDSRRIALRTLSSSALEAYTKGDYARALNLYMALDEKAPNQALVKYNIGTLLLILKEREQAVAYLKRAMELDPQESRYYRAYSHVAQGLAKDSYLSRRNRARQKQMQALGENQNTGGILEVPKAPVDQTVMANYGILGQADGQGVVITTVGLASKAARAELKEGDVIKKVDGTTVSRPQEINNILARKAPGEKVLLTIQREREIQDVIL